MPQPKRARRCQLSVPGSSEKMLLKAAELAVDHVFLDLEDAVAPQARASARRMIVEALNELDWHANTCCVRINDVSTEYCHDDIIEVVTGAGDKLDTIMLTKAKRAQDVVFVHLLLDQLEQKLGLKQRIGIECLIEEVEGMMNVDEIAACSDRLEALIFGMGDYAASQMMNLKNVGDGDVGYPPDIWHYPRYKLSIACHAHGLDPIDGPYANFKNTKALGTEAKRALSLGMAGKWAIHPAQIEIVQAAFTPEQQEVALARKQQQAYQEALSQGLGAIEVDGVMVDAASIRILQNLLDRAELFGL